jgi:hypothetical protein
VKTLEDLARLADGFGQGSSQITSKLILHPKGKLLELLCA